MYTCTPKWYTSFFIHPVLYKARFFLQTQNLLSQNTLILCQSVILIIFRFIFTHMPCIQLTIQLSSKTLNILQNSKYFESNACRAYILNKEGGFFSRHVNPLGAKPFSTLGKLRNWAKVGFCKIHGKFSALPHYITCLRTISFESSRVPNKM